MAGRYKVDILRQADDWKRRSSHKDQDDARLQSKRDLKRQPPAILAYRITLDGVVLETITREDL